MIIVTGANGQLGRGIVEHLLELVPAEQIGVSVQDTEKAQHLAQRGVRVRQGDYNDVESLINAFEGASEVLVISAPVTGEQGIRLNHNAIEAAKAAGAARVLYTSQMGSSSTSLFPPMLNHAATESILQASGMAFTSLRNGFYSSTVLFLLGNALETGKLIAPEDGKVAWTTHIDLATTAAITMAKGGLDGITPALTASEALDLDDIVNIVSELTGKSIQRITISEDEFINNLVSAGAPARMAQMQSSIFAASRQGEFSRINPTLANIIGRPPVSLRDFLKGKLS